MTADDLGTGGLGESVGTWSGLVDYARQWRYAQSEVRKVHVVQGLRSQVLRT